MFHRKRNRERAEKVARLVKQGREMEIKVTATIESLTALALAFAARGLPRGPA
jgi:hypothetical protein